MKTLFYYLMITAYIFTLNIQNIANAQETFVEYTESEVFWLSEHKEMIVGYPNVDYPPYILHDNQNNLIGIYKDYLSTLSELTGIKFTIKAYSNGIELKNALANSKVDFVVGISSSPTLMDSIYFTESFLSTPRSLIVNTSEPLKNASLASYSQHRFVAEKGYAMGHELKRYIPSVSIFEVDNTRDAISMVKYGIFDAYFTDKLTSKYYLYSTKNQHLNIVELTDIAPDSNHFALKLDNNILKGIINKAIRSIDDSTHSFIASRWSTPESKEKQQLNLDLNEKEYHWLKNNKVIYYTSSTISPPLSYSVDNGSSVQGLSIDVLKLAAERLGLSTQYIPTESKEHAVELLKQNEISVSSFFVDVNQVPEGIKLSESYTSTPWALTLPIDSKLTIEKFKNEPYIIANPQGYVNDSFIKSLFPYVEIRATPDMETSTELLKSGEVSAIFTLFSFASLWMQDEHMGEFKILNGNKIEKNLNIRMAAASSNDIFIGLLNKTLSNISTSEISEIEHRWLNYTINQGYNFKGVILPVIVVSIFILLVFLRVLYWNTKLKAEVNQRTQAEQRALNAEQAAIYSAKAKTEFLARMSHEIRTPMNGVLGMTEALSHTHLSDEQIDLLQTLQSSARNLMALLNDVLDFSKMDAGKVVFEEIPFALKDIFDACIDNYRHKAKSSGITLSSHIGSLSDIVFIGDPSRLTQIFNNLISNAIKFTEEGFIELRASLLTEKENQMVIQFDVRDSGIGIPSKATDSLFTAFVQAEGDTTRRFGGTGLGLTICHELVTSMKGEISIASEVGVGTVFSIVLPISFLPSETPDSYKKQIEVNDIHSLSSHADISTLKVLFAEDNPVNRKVISGQLSRIGVNADIVTDGKIALDKYYESDYDVIVSDCHMPNMDGFELASIISTTRENSKPYLIALTADAMSGSAQKCLDNGFDDYLSKPCPQELILKKLQEAKQVINTSYDFEAALADWEYTDTSGSSTTHESDIEECFVDEDITELISTLEMSEPVSLFDINKLLSLSGDDYSIANEILDSFLIANIADQKLLSESLKTQQLNNLKQIVHRIKGSIRYLAIDSLCEHAQDIEERLNEGANFFVVEQQIIEFLQALTMIIIEINDWKTNFQSLEELSHDL